MTRMLVLVPFAVATLAACSRPPAVESTALRCDAPQAGARVYIEIMYEPDGMPAATPDTCSVARGTEVEWRGPDGAALAFDIHFKRGNPMPAAPEGRLHSKASRGRQVAAGRAEAAQGRYDYAIRAGSKERDPAIIIR